jgi:hypothetical protein
MTPRMLRFIKNYATCNHPEQAVADFSYYKTYGSYEKEPHFWCANCESRWYKGRHWNPNEWDNYVNGDVE